MDDGACVLSCTSNAGKYPEGVVKDLINFLLAQTFQRQCTSEAREDGVGFRNLMFHTHHCNTICVVLEQNVEESLLSGDSMLIL